ncbi:vesicle-mediated transport protein [Aureococcus anophagefferens]|uniref:Coatomer subunit zeta n=1 Tax=Aureococcus anophagefferens TaxID=44056 RepID=A0ABR1G959_AURAN
MDIGSALSSAASRKQLRRFAASLGLGVDDALENLLALEETTVDAALDDVFGASAAAPRAVLAEWRNNGARAARGAAAPSPPRAVVALAAPLPPASAPGCCVECGARSDYRFPLLDARLCEGCERLPRYARFAAVMLDGCVAIFRARGDTFLYVVGAGHENELLLDTVLEGLFVALTILLDGSIESRYVLSNLDIAARRAGLASSTRLQYVMLAVDELVDQGKILEVEPKTIANRVLMRGVDGTTTITDMSIQDAMKVAQEQLIKSMS